MNTESDKEQKMDWFLTPGLQARYGGHNWRDVMAMRVWYNEGENAVLLFADGSVSKVIDLPEGRPSNQLSLRWNR